jgi:type I restriction enzyme S subunit
MVGGPFGSDLTAKDYVPMPGVPVIRGGNVSMGRFNEEDFVFVSREKADELAKNAARPGDLVMTQRGASLGEVTLLLADCGYEFYIISQTMMRMTPDSSKISPRFLLHYTCSAAAQKWLQGHQIATGQPHLNLGIYREMPALVPGRHEQEAIAAVMDHLHDAQNSNVPQLEQLKLVKSALMSVLFAGEVRVTPDEAAG